MYFASEESTLSGPFYSLGEAFAKGDILYEWCKTIFTDLVSEGALEKLEDEEGEPESEWLIEEITELIMDKGEVAYSLMRLSEALGKIPIQLPMPWVSCVRTNVPRRSIRCRAACGR